MQHKIHIASIVVPLEANESIDVEIPESIMVLNDVVDVAVERYNQSQVEVLFYEQYAVISIDEDGILEFTPEAEGDE